MHSNNSPLPSVIFCLLMTQCILTTHLRPVWPSAYWWHNAFKGQPVLLIGDVLVVGPAERRVNNWGPLHLLHGTHLLSAQGLTSDLCHEEKVTLCHDKKASVMRKMSHCVMRKRSHCVMRKRLVSWAKCHTVSWGKGHTASWGKGHTASWGKGHSVMRKRSLHHQGK